MTVSPTAICCAQTSHVCWRWQREHCGCCAAPRLPCGFLALLFLIVLAAPSACPLGADAQSCSTPSRRRIAGRARCPSPPTGPTPASCEAQGCCFIPAMNTYGRTLPPLHTPHSPTQPNALSADIPPDSARQRPPRRTQRTAVTAPCPARNCSLSLHSHSHFSAVPCAPTSNPLRHPCRLALLLAIPSLVGTPSALLLKPV